jgi:hypothetical protein
MHWPIAIIGEIRRIVGISSGKLSEACVYQLRILALMPTLWYAYAAQRERLIRLNEQLPATQFRKDECGCLFWAARRNDYRGRLVFGCQYLITGSHFFSV